MNRRCMHQFPLLFPSLARPGERVYIRECKAIEPSVLRVRPVKGKGVRTKGGGDEKSGVQKAGKFSE